VFSDLYLDHIALEDGVVYPAARRRGEMRSLRAEAAHAG